MCIGETSRLTFENGRLRINSCVGNHLTSCVSAEFGQNEAAVRTTSNPELRAGSLYERSLMTTSKSSASRRAMALPIPYAAPVTSAMPLDADVAILPVTVKWQEGKDLVFLIN